MTDDFDELDWGGDDEGPLELRVRFADLKPGETRCFPFVRDGIPSGGIVINVDGDPKVYVNRCPHVPYSLDFDDGNVQDHSREFLMCHSHGAMFLPETGECFMGPPVGRRLEVLPFEVDGDELVVTVPPEPGDWP